MGVFYPQAGMRLRVRWEDFGDEKDRYLSKISTIEVRVKEVHVTINDYTEADKFTAKIDYKEFPFDPRSIRALGVTIFIQDMKELFERQNNVKIQGFDSGGNSNIVFIGFADEERIKFDDLDRAVSFEGRDFTSLFLDQPFIRSTPLLMNKPVDKLVQGLVDEIKSTEKIKVENRTGETLPTMAQFAPSFSSSGGKRNTRKKDNYWDVIQNLASKAGLIAYIELDKLVITKPRALYKTKKGKQMIYGKNLKSLSFKRKLGREKGFNVAVRSLDFKTKNVIEVKIPEESSDAWASSIGIPQKRIVIKSVDAKGNKEEKPAPFISFLVPDVTNRTTLTKIGENIFEELSRQEIEGSLETNDMTVNYGSSDNPIEFDITKLRIGEPLLVEIADERDLSEIRRINSTSERADYFINLGYSREFAHVFAVAIGKFNPIFYTKSVEFGLDATGGFNCQVDFLNFIELPKALGIK